MGVCNVWLTSAVYKLRFSVHGLIQYETAADDSGDEEQLLKNNIS